MTGTFESSEKKLNFERHFYVVWFIVFFLFGVPFQIEKLRSIYNKGN